jgi:DNA-binding cell septation regulator SpoVG
MFEIIKMSLAKTSGKIKAFFTFLYAGLIVNGATIYINKDEELAIGFPSQKGKDNKYYSICYFRKEDLSKLEELKQVALEEYNRLVNKQ